jgi:glucose/arabinose dehydrogenase
MFRRRFVRAMQRLACMLAVLSLSGPTARAQDPAAMPMPGGAPMPGQPGAPAAAPSAGASWLVSSGGGLPWQVAVMFTGFWVLTAAEIAIVSKSAGRLDKPKKKDPDLQAD